MRRTGKTWLYLLLAGIVVLASSCDRNTPDLSRLKEDNFYVAQVDDRDVVLYIQEVSRKTVAGKWYVEDDEPAQPHRFVAKSKRLHRSELKSDSLKVELNALPKGDTLVIDLLMEDGWHTLDFVSWEQPSCMRVEKKYLYHDSLYKVECQRDVVYAQARGYWASYPEPNDPEGRSNYLGIMSKKLNFEDLRQRDLDLSMDIYLPIAEESTPRPLLLLIHGGSFFNGDKSAIGYVEWAEHFASRGYIVASINYRIGFAPVGQGQLDRAGYRAVQDAHAAMCYLLRHPEKYPIDPDNLFVGGTSAGGITALNLAFMRNENRPSCTYAEKALLDWSLFENLVRDDLGNIDAISVDSGDVAFTVNTVVNMWGAVHDLDILENSKQTAILSFHGDADHVVAYGYDYPFTNMKSMVREFIKEDKMYGSQCIHQKAGDLGMTSELHTKNGGGHSLHVGDDGNLSDYFTLITDTTTRFLYLRMFPQPTVNERYDDGKRWFVLDNAGELQMTQWEAIGGLVLEAEPDRVRVLYFADADKHGLILNGEQKNGALFQGEYDE